MDMAGALRARLLAAPAVTTKLWVSPTGQPAVYWVNRPQSTSLPAITMQVITEERAQHMGGFDGLTMDRVQIDIWALTYAETKAITEAVITALVPNHTGNGIDFSRAFLDGLRDLGERVETQFVHRTSFDLIFHHSTI